MTALRNFTRGIMLSEKVVILVNQLEKGPIKSAVVATYTQWNGSEARYTSEQTRSHVGNKNKLLRPAPLYIVSVISSYFSTYHFCTVLRRYSYSFHILLVFYDNYIFSSLCN